MASVLVQNTREGEDVPQSPVHEDGTRFAYAMRFDGFKYVAYADSPEELLDFLVPGYKEMDSQEQTTARVRLAMLVQSQTQALINAELDSTEWGALSEVEQGVLTGARVEQPHGWGGDDPMGDVWESHVPLVLVKTGYAPYTQILEPVSGIADVEDPPNILWLRPVDEWEFLVSLAVAGFISLHEATEI